MTIRIIIFVPPLIFNWQQASAIPKFLHSYWRYRTHFSGDFPTLDPSLWRTARDEVSNKVSGPSHQTFLILFVISLGDPPGFTLKWRAFAITYKIYKSFLNSLPGQLHHFHLFSFRQSFHPSGFQQCYQDKFQICLPGS